VEAIPHIEKWRNGPKIISSFLYFTLDKFIYAFALAKTFAKRKMDGYKKI
jgi:hypothetical protein